MNKILIASHGHLASGIQSSIGILTGLESKVSVIDAYVDENNYVLDIRKFIEELNGETGIIFTDLVGGSVNQKVILEAEKHPNILIVSGVNLPVVLSVILDVRPITREVLEEIVKSSQVEIVDLKDDGEDISDEDFLA